MRSKTLLWIGLAGLAVSVICNVILVVAAVRQNKELLLIYTKDLQMANKGLIMGILIASVLVGVVGIGGSFFVGNNTAKQTDQSP